MADNQNKSASRGEKQPIDKQQARRERQAQSLRQNLVRRKAQIREQRDSEAAPDPAAGKDDEAS